VSGDELKRSVAEADARWEAMTPEQQVLQLARQGFSPEDIRRDTELFMRRMEEINATMLREEKTP
jgi:hypothetical protein